MSGVTVWVNIMLLGWNFASGLAGLIPTVGAKVAGGPGHPSG